MRDAPRLSLADLTPDLEDGVPVDDGAEPLDAGVPHVTPPEEVP